MCTVVQWEICGLNHTQIGVKLSISEVQLNASGQITAYTWRFHLHVTISTTSGIKTGPNHARNLLTKLREQVHDNYTYELCKRVNRFSIEKSDNYKFRRRYTYKQSVHNCNTPSGWATPRFIQSALLKRSIFARMKNEESDWPTRVMNTNTWCIL